MKTVSRLIVLLTIPALFAAGCGWDVNGVDRMEELYPQDVVDVVEGEETNADATADTGLDTVEEDIATGTDATADTGSDAVATDTAVWPDVSYENIEGLWAVRLVSNTNMNVVLYDTKMSTSDLFIAEATAEGLTLTFCDEIIDITPVEMFSSTTTTKPALREAIAQTSLNLSVTGNSVDAQNIIWRWALADSIGDNDPLPEDVNTDNYPDLDSDGHEGVTIAVEFTLGGTTTGERYMAKRAKFNLGQGDMSADGRWITGSMTFDGEEKVLGADEALLKNGATITPDEESPSGYQMRRVDADFDCAALVAGHAAMFEQTP